jgi:hypothetical protein
MYIRQSRREITIGTEELGSDDRRLQSKKHILTRSSVCHSVCSSEMLGVITSQSTALVSPSPSL